MEMLDKILAWIKSIIIDWRIGTVGLIGFATGLIITKDMNLIIGVAVTTSMIIVDIFDKNHNEWHEKHLKKKLQKILSDPKHQQKFFDNCSDEEMKILTQLYRVYPNSMPMPVENIIIHRLESAFAISRTNNMGSFDFDMQGNRITLFPYALQYWAKGWLDNNKKRLKKNV